MFDEFDKEEENWRPESPKYVKVLKKIPGILFTVFAFSLITLMVVRLMMSKPPKSMEEMVWTEGLAQIYSESNGKLDVEHILCSDSFSEDRMFSVNAITYCASAEQLQVTLRYNDRSMPYLLEDYPDADKAEETYRFALRTDTDITYTGYSYTSASKMGYTYRHLIFDGVTLADVSSMHLEVYYSGDFDLTQKPRHSMYVFRYDFARSPYEIGEPEVGKYEIKTQLP